MKMSTLGVHQDIFEKIGSFKLKILSNVAFPICILYYKSPCMNMKYYFKPKEYIKELKADILKCERIADNRYAIAMQLYK